MLAEHMEIRKISFTGSTRTGRLIAQAAAMSNLKEVCLELGGKSPTIIFEDADLDAAAPAAAFSISWNSGQLCMGECIPYGGLDDEAGLTLTRSVSGSQFAHLRAGVDSRYFHGEVQEGASSSEITD